MTTNMMSPTHFVEEKIQPTYNQCQSLSLYLSVDDFNSMISRTEVLRFIMAVAERDIYLSRSIRRDGEVPCKYAVKISPGAFYQPID